MDGDRRVIDHDEALTAARRRFVRTSQLPMEELARDLNVSRATLYRVVGSRDRLLGDVLWQLADRTLDMVIAGVDATGVTGVDRVLQIAHHFDDEVSSFGPLQKFLQNESVDAFRILFTTAGQVHERMVAWWAKVLRETVNTGQLDGLPFELEETAYALVRIGESMLYGDMLVGIIPNIDLTDRLRRAVLLGGREGDQRPG